VQPLPPAAEREVRAAFQNPLCGRTFRAWARSSSASRLSSSSISSNSRRFAAAWGGGRSDYLPDKMCCVMRGHLGLQLLQTTLLLVLVIQLRSWSAGAFRWFDVLQLLLAFISFLPKRNSMLREAAAAQQKGQSANCLVATIALFLRLGWPCLQPSQQLCAEALEGKR
jgi:hypothetical protein